MVTFRHALRFPFLALMLLTALAKPVRAASSLEYLAAKAVHSMEAVGRGDAGAGDSGTVAGGEIEELERLLKNKRDEIRHKSESHAESSPQMKALREQESALMDRLRRAAQEAAKSLKGQLEAIDAAWAEGERRGWEPAHPEMKKLAQARAQAHKKLARISFLVGAREVILDLGGASGPEGLRPGRGVTMKLVRIEPGEFLMGSKNGASDEKPVRRVSMTKPFYMAATEVTQGQWKAVMGTEPWSGKPYRGRSKDAPANYVSWNSARDFCKKLSAKMARTVRMPTEAEWEYTCRAGTTSAYCFGDSPHMLGEYAWYEDNAEKAGQDHPQPVARKKPNAWGLYDMHGNVWEWCADWYDDGYYGSGPASSEHGVLPGWVFRRSPGKSRSSAHSLRDPAGPRSGEHRVLRGGSWDTDPSGLRAAIRDRVNPAHPDVDSGLRVLVSALE